MHMEQQLRQQQRQIMAPQMQQSLQMLQMTSMELDQYIEQALEINPFLDRVNARETVLSELPASASSQDGYAEDHLAQQYEQAVLGRSEPDHNPNEDVFDGWLPGERHREGDDLSRNNDAEEVWRYYQDSITRDESLWARLLDQMRITSTSPEEYAIGEHIIIAYMNANGYFTGDPTVIAADLAVPEAKVRAVLDTIRKFEPTGVGAADLRECLLLQAEVEYPDEPELIALIDNHLDDLLQGRIPQIARALGVSPERVVELKSLLARLDPFPGREYGGGDPAYITPEIVVEKIEDDYIVVLTSDDMPAVRINEAYIKDVRGKKISSEERAYVREKLDAARWLLRNIERRQDTIRKTAQAIVDAQRDFMEKGVEHMKPLTLEEIAEKIGMHESTVSRTVNGKYIQTPQGLFELKYFFSSGLRSDDGESQSSTAVCANIKKIIEQEDKLKPLSDQKIADILKQQGVQVARRTVTKYREQMNIFPAKMRRSY